MLLAVLNVVVLSATALARATALAPGGSPVEPLDNVEVELTPVAEGEGTPQAVSAPPSPGFQR